jgi:hypothetical protein
MTERQSHFLPECFADTLLVKMLIKYTPNHQANIAEVFKSLKGPFANKKAIGIIDDDKRKDVYYKKFTIVTETDYYRHLSHPNKKHHLIVLKKACDSFIYNCAQSLDVDHPYLKNFELLKRRAKSVNVDTDNDFKNLINTLIQKKAAPLMEIQAILLEQITH